MSNQGQGLLRHFIYDLYGVCLYEAHISGERLQDHWFSGYNMLGASWSNFIRNVYVMITLSLSLSLRVCGVVGKQLTET